MLTKKMIRRRKEKNILKDKRFSGGKDSGRETNELIGEVRGEEGRIELA